MLLMCGIVGIVSPDLSPSAGSVRGLERLSEDLAHRGPDDVGAHVDGPFGVAVRRLAIIDLEGGRQPLSNETGRIWVACNGEIYNSPALRTRLEAAGHRFRTRSDVETIVHGYEEWGDGVAEQLRGMFAFAVWDAEAQRLLLARDRFGIKPLHYAASSGGLGFSSEIRTLLTALPALSRTVNREALWRLFELGFVPSPLTMFEGVHKVPAGHLLTWQAGSTRLRPFWRPQCPGAGMHRTLSFDEAGEAFEAQLRDAVDAWRLSDVPVGALLSGGIDSAALAALLSDAAQRPIHTFSIGFDAASHDESTAARLTARHLGSHHHEVRFSANDFDLLPTAVRHLEEPRCSATSVPVYLLYQRCHQSGFKVIMTGEGADELLGGYHWFDGDRRARALLRLPRAVRRVLSRLPVRASDAARRVLRHGSADPVERYRLWQQVGDPAQVARLVGERRPAVSDAWRRAFADDLQGRHPLDQLLLLDSRTRLVDDINLEVDRMSMAHSVEARAPFLDHRLWEFAAGVPPTFKLSWRGDKRLLRRAMAARLPEPVRCRPKRGLATPHAAWWRVETLPRWAEEALHPSAIVEADYFDPAEVRRLREAHRLERMDASRLLMGVLTTQLWHTQVLRG